MRLTMLALAVAVIISIVPAKVSAEDLNLSTVGGMRKACLSNDAYYQGYCLGFLRGLVNLLQNNCLVMEITGNYDEMFRAMKAPDGLTYADIRQLFIDKATRAKDRHGEDAFGFMADEFHTSYHCKGKTKG